MVRIYAESGFLDPNKPIRDYTEKELHDFLYKEPTKVKVQGINMTYEGLVPHLQKSLLSKDKDALQPHIRAFVERAVTFRRAPSAAAPGSTRRRSSKIDGINIADACAMQISDLAEWVRGLDDPSIGAARRDPAADPGLVRRDRPRLPQPRPAPARSPAARPSAPR